MRRLLALLIFSSLLSAQVSPPAPSDDPRKRAKTVRDYAKAGGDIAPIAPYLKDPDVGVQRAAVESIVRIGGRNSIEPLIEATRIADEEIQVRATDGLVNFYLPGYIQQGGGLTGSLKRTGDGITAKFSDSNDQMIEPHLQVREEVSLALAKVSSGGAGLATRANATRAIGILRARPALPDVYAGLRSKDSRLIYESLTAIEKIGDPAAAPEIAFLLRDLDEKVQLAAIEATGQLGNRAALPRLLEAVDGGRSIRVKRAALIAVAKIPDEASRPVFQRLLEDKDDGMRAAAAEGIGRLKNPADRPAVQRLFDQEGKRNARLSQAFAAVLLGNLETTPESPMTYLVDTLNSVAYKGVAHPFLVELCRDEPTRRVVYQMLPLRTREEKTALAGVLGQSGGKDTEPILEGMSRDPDVQIAQAGARALRTLRARLP